MSDFFKRFGRPETWETGQGIACGSAGCRPISSLPQESIDEMTSMCRWLKAERAGEFTGTLDDWRAAVAKALEVEE